MRRKRREKARNFGSGGGDGDDGKIIRRKKRIVTQIVFVGRRGFFRLDLQIPLFEIHVFSTYCCEIITLIMDAFPILGNRQKLWLTIHTAFPIKPCGHLLLSAPFPHPLPSPSQASPLSVPSTIPHSCHPRTTVLFLNRERRLERCRPGLVVEGSRSLLLQLPLPLTHSAVVEGDMIKWMHNKWLRCRRSLPPWAPSWWVCESNRAWSSSAYYPVHSSHASGSLLLFPTFHRL